MDVSFSLMMIYMFLKTVCYIPGDKPSLFIVNYCEELLMHNILAMCIFQRMFLTQDST